jgi:soluble lytic murein transglycosylase-like protein
MPTITPTPKPTLIPSPTSVPQPKVNSQQIYEFTNRFGGQYGVDPNVLRHVALCESGFRPDAKNNIYAGLYQFDSRTWKTYREKMGEDTDPDLRFNGEEAVQTAAYAISLGKLHLWPNCKP